MRSVLCITLRDIMKMLAFSARFLKFSANLNSWDGDRARRGAADTNFVACCTSTCAYVSRQDYGIGLYCRVREGSSFVGYCVHGCACVCIHMHMLFYMDLSAGSSLRHRIISEVVELHRTQREVLLGEGPG
jgi:hypothetical protein